MMVPSFAPGREVPQGIQGIQGLGEYPGYYCYDAARPSWLPYWLDDITESACKWNPKTIAGNIYHCTTGAPDCGNPSVAQQDPSLSGPGVAAAGEPSNTPDCKGFAEVYNPATNQCEFNPTSPALLLAGGALLAVVLLLRR